MPQKTAKQLPAGKRPETNNAPAGFKKTAVWRLPKLPEVAWWSMLPGARLSLTPASTTNISPLFLPLLRKPTALLSTA
jgi:hypothetical protein